MSNDERVEVREEWDLRTIPRFHQRAPYFLVPPVPDPLVREMVDILKALIDDHSRTLLLRGTASR